VQQPQIQDPYQVPAKRSTPVVAIVIGIIAAVVIVVILLIAIAVPVFMNARSNAQRRTCQSNQRTVDGAIQAYEAMFENPVYPTGFEDMLKSETRTLKSIPTCPSSDKPYIWVDGSPPSISCPNNSTHTI
jgi:competence protein ComGC